MVDLRSGLVDVLTDRALRIVRDCPLRVSDIDIGMLDVQVGFLANQAMNHLVSGRTPQRSGNAHPNIQPQDVFDCRDGKIVIVVGNDGQFVKFCEALGRPEWAKEERFATNPARVRNREALNPMIVVELIKHGRAHWVAALEAVGVPCGPINSIPEALADEQVRHRGMLFELAHPSGSKLPQIASPMRFREAPLEQNVPPPLLGQHTLEILHELGLGNEEIEDLRKTGTI